MHRLPAWLAGLSMCLMLPVISGCSTLGFQPRNKAEVVSTTGANVTIFYGASKEARAVFCPGETVQVYRQESRERLRYIEQGKVKITRILDENYLEGVVVEGSIKPGYFAGKAGLSCLVTSPQ